MWEKKKGVCKLDPRARWRHNPCRCGAEIKGIDWFFMGSLFLVGVMDVYAVYWSRLEGCRSEEFVDVRGGGVPGTRINQVAKKKGFLE